MVASGLLNFFQPPAKPSVNSNATSTAALAGQTDTQGSAAAGRKFARMVDDSSDTTRTRERQSARASKAPAHETTVTTRVSARERISQSNLTPQQLDRQITPEEAQDILAEFEASGSLLGDLSNDPSTQQQLKEQLQGIVDSQTPKTVEEIIADLDTTPDAMAELSLNADIPEGVTVQAVLTHTAQRVLNLFNKALSAPSQETPAQDGSAEVANSAINPALLALQAAAFPAVAIEAQAVEETAATPAIQTMTVVTPLAQQTAISTYTTVASAEVEGVEEMQLAAVQDINARIPSLTLVKDKEALPEVELPSAQLPAATEAAPAIAKSAVDITRQLEALGTTVKAFTGKEETTAEVKPVLSVNTHVISPLQGASGTLSPHAIAPATGVLGAGTVNHAPVSGQVSVAIRQASASGIDEITVQLDPLGLGRVEVKMHMNKDGHTQISFMVDKPETFDALSRDARSLEQSLQEAGIKADTSGMQFNLRQQNQQQTADNDPGSNGNGQTGSAPTAAKPDEHAAVTQQPTKNYRLDIRDGVDIQA